MFYLHVMANVMSEDGLTTLFSGTLLHISVGVSCVESVRKPKRLKVPTVMSSGMNQAFTFKGKIEYTSLKNRVSAFIYFLTVSVWAFRFVLLEVRPVFILAISAVLLLLLLRMFYLFWLVGITRRSFEEMREANQESESVRITGSPVKCWIYIGSLPIFGATWLILISMRPLFILI